MDGVENKGYNWVATAFDMHGALVLFLLAVGWLWSALVRRRELKRIEDGGGCSYGRKANAGKDLLQGEKPSMCIVIPTKGVKTHSMRNWQSFVKEAEVYKGRVEMLFCLECSSDPAISLIEQLKAQSQDIDVKIVIAGRAKTCSQKLHNIIAGIDGCSLDSKYVLFLDDDVLIHKCLLDNLVNTLEYDQTIFMATAYPFDVPAPNSGIIPFCVAAYHLRLIIAFSLGSTAKFVWGGCMLYHTSTLKEDTYGLVSSWKNGGYSDDLIVSSLANAKKLTISCNPSAVLYQELDAELSFASYWNYCRRQVYVLDTYTTKFNRRVNHTLLVLHSYLSIGFVGSMLLNAWRVFVTLVNLGDMLLFWRYDSSYLSHFESMSTILFFACFLLALGALHAFVNIVEHLFFCLYEKHLYERWHFFDWIKVWVALCIDSGSFVPAALMTMLSSEILWSNVKYVKGKGLVKKVIHCKTPLK